MQLLTGLTLLLVGVNASPFRTSPAQEIMVIHNADCSSCPHFTDMAVPDRQLRSDDVHKEALLRVAQIMEEFFDAPRMTPTLSEFGRPVIAERCEWFGTAPICDGVCPPELPVLKRRDNSGDGSRCLTGTKALCCES